MKKILPVWHPDVWHLCHAIDHDLPSDNYDPPTRASI